MFCRYIYSKCKSVFFEGYKVSQKEAKPHLFYGYISTCFHLFIGRRKEKKQIFDDLFLILFKKIKFASQFVKQLYRNFVTMAKKVNEGQTPDSFESIEGALSKTEQYIEDNQKSISIIVAVVLVLFGGYFGFKKFVLEPKQDEALSQMYEAEKYFKAAGSS